MILVLPMLAMGAATAKAQSFEAELRKAEEITQLARVIGPFLQQCSPGNSLQAIQCRAIRSRMQHRVKGSTFWSTVDAVRAGAYDNARLNFPVSVVGCLTCDAPLKLDETLYGAKSWYVTTDKPRSVKMAEGKPQFVGLDLKQIIQPVGPAQVEVWMQNVLPNLKVQFIYHMEGETWPAALGNGLVAKLVGYRLYDQCSGKVLVSSPPSTSPAPVAKANTCGRVVADTPREEPRQQTIPAKLSPRDIQDSMRRLDSQVQTCYDQFQVAGLAEVVVTAKGDTGIVVKVDVLGKFKDSPTTGKCVIDVVRKARFPMFRTPTMTFRYRWYLR